MIINATDALAVISNELSPDRDMGGDGSLLSRVARDAYGYSLGYHGGDYAPIGGTQAQGVVASETALASASQAPNLWNGNIRSMATTLADPQTYTPQPQLATYSYDQLNRIKSMQVYQSLSQNAWQPLGTQAYASGFTYDANGNILTKTQKDKDGNWCDQLDYKYQTVANGNKRNTNRLGYVTDATTTPTDATDIETQAAGNYAYDGIGNLIQDNAEDIANIEWTVYGKVKKVTRKSGSTRPDLEFAYDAGGHRVAKIVKPAATKTDPNTYTTTVYVLDASGNTMATYQLQGTQYQLEDQYLYGSSRIGVASRNETMNGTMGDVFVVGNKHYELTNHLGNVLAVISDRRVYVTSGTQTDPIFVGTVPSSISYGIGYAQPDILSTTDYYPFGESMAGRSYQGGGYRYGFNGKEKDEPGLGGGGSTYDYGFRIYNPALGKFLSIDPINREYPWITPYAFAENNPIIAIDLEGLQQAPKTKPEPENRNSPKIVKVNHEEVKKLTEDQHKGVNILMDRFNLRTGSPKFDAEIYNTLYKSVIIIIIGKQVYVFPRSTDEENKMKDILENAKDYTDAANDLIEAYEKYAGGVVSPTIKKLLKRVDNVLDKANKAADKDVIGLVEDGVDIIIDKYPTAKFLKALTKELLKVQNVGENSSQTESARKIAYEALIDMFKQKEIPKTEISELTEAKADKTNVKIQKKKK